MRSTQNIEHDHTAVEQFSDTELYLYFHQLAGAVGESSLWRSTFFGKMEWREQGRLLGHCGTFGSLDLTL